MKYALLIAGVFSGIAFAMDFIPDPAELAPTSSYTARLPLSVPCEGLAQMLMINSPLGRMLLGRFRYAEVIREYDLSVHFSRESVRQTHVRTISTSFAYGERDAKIYRYPFSESIEERGRPRNVIEALFYVIADTEEILVNLAHDEQYLEGAGLLHTRNNDINLLAAMLEHDSQSGSGLLFLFSPIRSAWNQYYPDQPSAYDLISKALKVRTDKRLDVDPAPPLFENIAVACFTEKPRE